MGGLPGLNRSETDSDTDRVYHSSRTFTSETVIETSETLLDPRWTVTPTESTQVVRPSPRLPHSTPVATRGDRLTLPYEHTWTPETISTDGSPRRKGPTNQDEGWS